MRILVLVLALTHAHALLSKRLLKRAGAAVR